MTIQGISAIKAKILCGKLPKAGHFIRLGPYKELRYNDFFKHITKNKFGIFDYKSGLNLLEDFI